MQTLMTQKILYDNADISDKYFINSKKIKNLQIKTIMNTGTARYR